jgi:RimJ/RimL family protein N-acetyltransferase
MEDAPHIVPLANNRKIAEQTRRMPHPYALTDAQAWISLARRGIDKGETAYLLTRKDDGRIVGAAGIVAMNETEFEIGYWIAEPFWSEGFATEAAQAVIDNAFLNRSLDRIFGRCRVANTPSRRVLEKCGFQYAGSGMCDCAALNSAFASEEFVLERFVWESLKRWGAA